jgi:hypothetical protein
VEFPYTPVFLSNYSLAEIYNLQPWALKKRATNGLALGVGRLIAAQLYQVSAHNPAPLGGAMVLLAAVALLACLLPARGATLVDPIQALRTE